MARGCITITKEIEVPMANGKVVKLLKDAYGARVFTVKANVIWERYKDGQDADGNRGEWRTDVSAEILDIQETDEDGNIFPINFDDLADDIQQHIITTCEESEDAAEAEEAQKQAHADFLYDQERDRRAFGL